MAIGKNKRISKGKKGGKKKTVDPLSRKEWYDFKSPAPFEVKSFGKTLVTRTTGTKIASERIKGRVVEVSLADLKNNADASAWRKIRLFIEDTEGKNVRTSFYGMNVTRDKLCQFIKKWQDLIEATCEVKTKDGFILRCFCIGFTRKQEGQIKKTCYAQRSQTKKIRKAMVDIITKAALNVNLTEFVKHLISESIGDEIIKATKFIFPLQHVLVRKVKMLKKPKFDATKLNELFEEKGKPAESKPRAEDEEESKNLLKK